jgi:hypothetical protein
MLKQTNRVWIIGAFAAMVATGSMLGNPAQKTSVPKPQDTLALGEDEVKKLLLIMEPDKQGKISKQEYMRFMRRNSKDWIRTKTASWTSSKLTQSSVTTNRFVGK